MGIEIGNAAELNILMPTVLNFYKKFWQRPIALGDQSFYEWQFINAPVNQAVDHCCFAVYNGELIGSMGVTPRQFFINEKTQLGAELTSWMILDEHKGGGLGALMMDFLQSKFNVLTGTGVSEAAMRIDLRKGYSLIKGIPRYVRVFNWDAVKEHAIYTPLAKKLHNDRHKQMLQEKNKQYTTEEVTAENLNPIVDKFRKTHCFFSRYFPDINWRYHSHPMFTYKTIIIKSGVADDSGAFLAYRIDTNINGFSILHIMDLFGDTNSVQEALSWIQKLAITLNIDVADFSTTSSFVGAFFRKARWFSILDDSYFNFPHLFHPLELRNPATPSVVYWSKDDHLAMHDVGRLYITKQDVDLDRPILKTTVN